MDEERQDTGQRAGRRPADLREHVQVLACDIGEALDLDAVDVWQTTPDGHAVVCRACWSAREEELQATQDAVGAVIELEQSHDLRRLVLTGETVEHHVDDASLPASALAALQVRGHRTRVDAPLLLDGAVIGVLSVADARRVRRFTEQERRQLARFARAAAGMLDAAWCAEQEAERAQRLLAVVDAGSSPAASLRALEAVKRTRHQVERALDDRDVRVDVVLRRDDGTCARLATVRGKEELSSEIVSVDALARQAMERVTAQRAKASEGRERLVVPLVAGGTVDGYLDLEVASAHRLRDDELDLLRVVAAQSAAGLRVASAYKALENRAATDMVTGLYTRWHFYERLYAEVRRADRYQQPLALLLAGLDGGAKLRAVRGEPFADTVLRGLARLVCASLRDKVDVVFRHGDTRFAVLLPNTTAFESGACLVAERIRLTVEQTRLKDDDLGSLGRCTMSLVAAGYPSLADDADELVGAAETALATAMRAGTNQVVLAQRL